MEQEKQAVGDKLRALRKLKGLRQEDVAAVLGTSRTAYSGWEIGRYEAGRENLNKLAEFYDVPIDMLVDDTVVFTGIVRETPEYNSRKRMDARILDLSHMMTKSELENFYEYGRFLVRERIKAGKKKKKT